MTEIQVPGKLYISGEYAVLENGQPAILIAVDQFIKVKINSHPNGLKLMSRQIGLEDLTFTWDQLPDDFQGPWKYVLSGLHTFKRTYQGELKDFQLEFNTDLVHSSGYKIGLGSSGAVVVATLKALAQLHSSTHLQSMDIFKLAAIALTKAGSQGSMGDLAASVFGGWVYYQAYDRQWLQNELQLDRPLNDLLTADWPGLIIENLIIPSDIIVAIGWTHSPASTDQLVGKLGDQLFLDDGSYYRTFLSASKTSVNRLKDGLVRGEIGVIREEIDKYHQLLSILEATYHLNIITPELSKLIEIAREYQYASKSSGAGGGDCGIAISQSKAGVNQSLYKAWQNADIIPLDYSVAPIQ